MLSGRKLLHGNGGKGTASSVPRIDKKDEVYRILRAERRDNKHGELKQ